MVGVPSAGPEEPTVGNRSKRGRPDPDAPDPVVEFQEEARWSGYTRHIRWPNVPRSGPHLRRLPTGGQWLAIFVVGLAAVGAVFLVLWALFAFLGSFA
jgi:hypothetical protein